MKDTQKDVTKTLQNAEYGTGTFATGVGRLTDGGAKLLSKGKVYVEDKIKTRSEKEETSKAQVEKDTSVAEPKEEHSILGIRTAVEPTNTDIQYDSDTTKPSNTLTGIRTLVPDNKTSPDEITVETIQDDTAKDSCFRDRFLHFLNKHTFDFQEEQGKFSKGVTIFGKTSVVSGKALKTGARISKATTENLSPENAVQLKSVQKAVHKKIGKTAGKAGKELTKRGFKYGWKGTKATVKFSYKKAKSSVKLSKQALKSTAAFVKKVATSVGQAVIKIGASLVQALAPYMVGIIAGVVALGIMIAFIGAFAYQEQVCNGNYVVTDGTFDGNAKAIWSFYKGKGLSDYAVAGVMGNMEAESGLNPAAIEGNGQGYGLIQWSFGRKTKLINQAAKEGVVWTDLNFQLNYLWSESLSPTTSYGKRMETEGFYTKESASDCAYIFHKIVEVSADSPDAVRRNRGAKAEKWYQKFHGTGSLTDMTGCASGNVTGDPDFSNDKAWKAPNNPYAPTYYGQCTWFAWGRFYEIYGYSPGFTGNGYQCVRQLLNKHGDKFRFGKTPKVGAVGSSDKAHNHVWIVVGVEGNNITVQEGNLNGKTDSWAVAITDWWTHTYTLEELRATYGDISFANPI